MNSDKSLNSSSVDTLREKCSDGGIGPNLKRGFSFLVALILMCQFTSDILASSSYLAIGPENPSIQQECKGPSNDLYSLDICFESAVPRTCGYFEIEIDSKTYGPFTYAESSAGGSQYCVSIEDDAEFDSKDEEDGVLTLIRDCDQTIAPSLTIYDEFNCPNHDLAVMHTIIDAGPYYPGQQVSFLVSLINQGDIDAYNISLLDVLHQDLIFTASNNSIAETGNPVDWIMSQDGPVTLLPKLDAGETQSLKINLVINNTTQSFPIENAILIHGAKDLDGNDFQDEDGIFDGSMPDMVNEVDNEISDESMNSGAEVFVDHPNDFDHFDFARFAACISSVTFNGPQESCEGGSISIMAVPSSDSTEPVEYSWTGPDFAATGEYMTIDGITLDQAGTYTLVATDADMCVSQTSFDIEVYELPDVTIEPLDLLCSADEPLTLVGSPAGGTFYGTGVVGNVFYPAIAGDGDHQISYSFTDSYGCTSQVSQYTSVHGATTLSCKGDLNISLDIYCELNNIDINLFVDSDDIGFLTYQLSDEYGNIIDLDDIGMYAGECIVYEVIDVCTSNSCWGNICIEDKIDPSNVNCDCETPYIDDGGVLVENPNCVFYCFQLWDLEVLEAEGGYEDAINEVLPPVSSTIPYDNCLDFPDPQIYLDVVQGDNCDNKYVNRTIVYNYVDYDGTAQTIECAQTFLFKPVDSNSYGNTVDGLWDDHDSYEEANEYPSEYVFYRPEHEIRLPCGYDISPASIAAYYDIDTPGSSATGVADDDFSETPNIVENNEGIPYGYPYVVVRGYDGKYHPKAIKNNICNLYAVYEDQIAKPCGDDCPNSGKIIARQWTFLDWCNAETTIYVQAIATDDKTPPTLGNPDLTVSVDPWECTATVEMPRPEHLHDDCDDNPSWRIIPPLGADVIGNTLIGLEIGVTPVIYEAFDCCGNVSQYQVLVNVIDKVPPVAIGFENIVVNLTTIIGDDGKAKIRAEDIDNFSYDDCGPVHLEIRRADGNIWCHPGNGTFNNDGHLDDLDTDDDDGAFVIFCCEDIMMNQDDEGNFYGEYDVILRVWDDGDMNGIFGTFGDNYNETWSKVRVEDKLTPTVVCPPDVEIQCEQDWNDYSVVGKPLAYTSCGELECDNPKNDYVKKPANTAPFLGEEIHAYNPTCRRGAIRRTWNCGGKVCTQWIIVRENDNVVEIKFPNDTIINCLSGPVEEPSFLYDQCELLGVSVDIDTFYFEEGACYKLLKHWSIINWCDYDVDDPDLNDIPEPEDDGYAPGIHQHTQVVKLFDEDDPILLAEDQTVTTNGDCVTEGATISAIATDEGACASDWIKWDVEIDLWGDLSVDYFYSSGLPPSDPFYIAPTFGTGSHTDSMEMGSQVTILLPDGLEAQCGIYHRVKWSAYDGCGNARRVTKTLEIKDGKAPTPYMVNVNTAVMNSGAVELWASDFNIGSFDNCYEAADLLYTFSSTAPPQLLDPSIDVPWYDVDGIASQSDFNNGDAEKWNGDLKSSSMVFDCDIVEAAFDGGGVYDLEVYCWDPCGNYDFAIVSLSLIDNNAACGLEGRASISGNVKTEDGEGVMDFALNITSDLPGYPSELMTQDDGSYTFGNNPMYNDYILQGEKNDDWLNGVSTLDLVLIQKHILGTQLLSSPYKLIAADASNDQNVSSLDLIQLRKLILGVTPDLANNNSWRLVDATENLNPINPWPFDEFLAISQLDQNMTNENFIAVKIGDVNGNAAVNLAGDSVESRSNASLELTYQNVFVEEGQEIVVDITSNNFDKVHGFQFAMNLNGLSLSDISSDHLSLSANNIAKHGDHVRVSWNGNKMINIQEDAVMNIAFVANKSGWLSNMVSLDDEAMRGEAYVGEAISIKGVSLDALDEIHNYYLGQNEPNPWVGSTNISFAIPESGKVSLSFFDIDGRLLFTKVNDFEAGLHQVIIDQKDLKNKEGIVYYKLEVGQFSSTKKMIIFE